MTEEEPLRDLFDRGRYGHNCRVDVTHDYQYGEQKPRKRRPQVRQRFPDFEYTLLIVRTAVQDFIIQRNTEALTKEGLARKHTLDPGLVQRALGQLRTEGLLNRPTRKAPLGTWRGGDYDEWSAWHPTLWTVRFPKYSG